MYEIDELDEVVELGDVPQSSVGAPCPMVLAGEHRVHLAYFLQETPESWDGTTARMVGEDTDDEPCALVRFTFARAHMFGPPNDEAFEGHPLSARGLRPYSVWEVHQSSWIRKLERMNSVHPYHRPEHFARYKHFIFAFHDRVFECIAEDFTFSKTRGSVVQTLTTSWWES